MADKSKRVNVFWLAVVITIVAGVVTVVAYLFPKGYGSRGRS